MNDTKLDMVGGLGAKWGCRLLVTAPVISPTWILFFFFLQKSSTRGVNRNQVTGHSSH